MANFLFFHVDLKAIKTIDPVKKVSVLYLLRFLRNVVLKLMPWCQVNGNKYIYIHISSRFIYSKMELHKYHAIYILSENRKINLNSHRAYKQLRLLPLVLFNLKFDCCTQIFKRNFPKLFQCSQSNRFHTRMLRQGHISRTKRGHNCFNYTG